MSYGDSKNRDNFTPVNNKQYTVCMEMFVIEAYDII